VAAALVGAATDDDTALDEAMLAARGEAGRPMLDDPRGWLIAAAAERALWRGDLDAALDWLDGGRDRVTVQRMSASGSWAPTSIPSADASLPRRLALRARAIADVRILDRLAGRATGEDAGSAEAVAAEIRRMERHRGISRAARAELACARAELARGVRMRPSAEARAWERAVTVAAQEQRPYAEAYARWRLAEAALAAHADRARATAEMARGMALAAALGASSLRRELELLARRARLTVVGPTIGATKEAGGQSPSPFALTERELEVIGLLAVGATNREIGARLFISPRTASVHVSNILAKLGASNRTEAAALAHRLGIDGHGGTP
jgi:DNA-binding NarL/FixJ family response regulator